MRRLFVLCCFPASWARQLCQWKDEIWSGQGPWSDQLQPIRGLVKTAISSNVSRCASEVKVNDKVSTTLHLPRISYTSHEPGDGVGGNH